MYVCMGVREVVINIFFDCIMLIDGMTTVNSLLFCVHSLVIRNSICN